MQNPTRPALRRLSRRLSRLSVPVLCFLALLTANAVSAADANQRFATKGAGLISCGEMRTVTKQRPEMLQRFAGWTAGYVSAVNQMSPDTFDVLLFENAESVFQYVYEYCGRNKTENFSIATGRIVEALRATKITEFRSVARLYPSSGYEYYEEVIERIIATLIGKGLLTTKSETPDENDLKTALIQFQKQQNLPETGDADQLTLIRLLRRITDK